MFVTEKPTQVVRKQLLHFENAVQTWLAEMDADKKVILKLATAPSGNDAINKELWCLRNLQHTNSVDILLEAGDEEAENREHQDANEDSNIFYVRRYFPHSLSQRLIEADAITIDDAAAIILQLFEQLIAQHDKGFLYVDVKPDNLLLSEEGQLVMCDLGSCVAFNDDALKIVKDLPFWSQKLYSSAKYLHPKTTSNINNLGPWVDIYAAGKVIDDIATKLPANQSARFKEISEKCTNVDVTTHRTVLNQCIALLNNRLDDYRKDATKLFDEDEDNYVDTNVNEASSLPFFRNRLTLYVLSIAVIIAICTTVLLGIDWQDTLDANSEDTVSLESQTDTLSSNNPILDNEDVTKPVAPDAVEVFTSLDTEVKEVPEVDVTRLDATYRRELIYQDENGAWVRVPFIKQVIDEQVIWVSVREVDNKLYDACIRAGKCTPNTIFSTRESRKKLNAPEMPAVNISRVMIDEEFLPFASSLFGIKMRLPTLGEWQQMSASARKGIIDGVYSMHCKNCNRVSGYRDVANSDGEALPVDAFSPDAVGFVNTYGNVREWLSGCAYDASGIERCYQAFVVGGSWRDDYRDILNNPVDVLQIRAKSIDTGFRLVFNE